MTKTLEEQAIDNENRIALMAAIIAGGVMAAQAGLPSWRLEDYERCALSTVRLARAIQKEAGR